MDAVSTVWLTAWSTGFERWERTIALQSSGKSQLMEYEFPCRYTRTDAGGPVPHIRAQRKIGVKDPDLRSLELVTYYPCVVVRDGR